MGIEGVGEFVFYGWDGELHRCSRRIGHYGWLSKSAAGRWRCSVWHGVWMRASAPGSRCCLERGSAMGRSPSAWEGAGRRSGGRRSAAGRAAYCVVVAQADVDGRAKRPRASRLAADGELHWLAQDRLVERLSPHAISADLCELVYKVCAETFYRACYHPDVVSDLKPGTWKKLPRSHRWCKPQSRC